MARREDPDRITDLRRYRRERERAQRAAQKTPANEPVLGRRKHASLFLIGVFVVLFVLWWLQRR